MLSWSSPLGLAVFFAGLGVLWAGFAQLIRAWPPARRTRPDDAPTGHDAP